MLFSSFLTLVPFLSLTFAGPTNPVQKREFDLPGNLAAILKGVDTAISSSSRDAVITALRGIEPITKAITTPDQAAAALQKIFNGTSTRPATLTQYIANLEALNLIDSIDSLLDFVNGVANGQDSPNNNNAPPPDTIYPKKLDCDAPYSVDEDTLRSAIYIPPTFTKGRVPPIILFPGTGNYGYETFAGNFIPLLQGSDFADPVWVNVPGRLLNDAQKNAEFAAYAINYIASITKTNVTMLAWSQGNINTQWAFKYWPSTTKVTTDHVAISPDYAGTIIANFAALPGAPLPPSLLQQEYLASSDYITTLRTCNGDSSYVPTTTIYSGFFDEIVEPQQGTGASAFLNNARGVGASNNEVQLVCAGKGPGGTFYTHEGVLYHPLSYYLLRDAMKNPGAGSAKRLNLNQVCATYLAPGLDLGDLLVTENAIAIAGLAILTYPNPVINEPAISAYAKKCPTSTCLKISTSSTSTSTKTTSRPGHGSSYESNTQWQTLSEWADAAHTGKPVKPTGTNKSPKVAGIAKPTETWSGADIPRDHPHPTNKPNKDGSDAAWEDQPYKGPDASKIIAGPKDHEEGKTWSDVSKKHPHPAKPTGLEADPAIWSDDHIGSEDKIKPSKGMSKGWENKPVASTVSANPFETAKWQAEPVAPTASTSETQKWQAEPVASTTASWQAENVKPSSTGPVAVWKGAGSQLTVKSGVVVMVVGALGLVLGMM